MYLAELSRLTITSPEMHLQGRIRWAMAGRDQRRLEGVLS
jgi:hypothetical protein